MWVKEFKIALIEKNTDKLVTLIESLPQIKKPEEIDEVLHLLQAAIVLIKSLREDTKISMVQMKKNIDFLQSTQAPLIGKLDITS